MDVAEARRADRSGGSKLGSPPIPHEHGAWVILYAPLLIAFAAAPHFQLIPALLLSVGVTGAFLARNAAGIVIRRKAREPIGFWLFLFTAAMVAGLAPLVLVFGRWELLWIGIGISAIFAVHAFISTLPSRKRMDRSVFGELLAVAALVSTAPAAHVVSGGALDGLAVCLWAACFLYFGSGILNVKMLLAAVKIRREFTWADRWEVGGANLLYHLFLLVVVIWTALKLGGIPGMLAWAAFLPVIHRGFVNWATLSSQLPPLKRVGITETVYSLWFAACFIAAVKLSV